MTVDRIGRIETILYSLVEQQKAGPTASAAVLNEIVQDVKQLQNLNSGSEIDDPDTSDFGRGIFQGFPRTPGQQEFNPVPTAAVDRHPSNTSRRYTDSVVNVQDPSGDAFHRPSRFPTTPREHQRRRLHSPIQTFSPSAQDPDVDDDTQNNGDEIVQLTGQLSLDENKTVRYHGSSSGLTLLTRSKRFDGTFWNLPNPGMSSQMVSDSRFLACLG